MRSMLLFAMMAAAVSSGAAPVIPEVSNVKCSKGPRYLTVTYDLSADAVVTLDIVTNGISVGEGVFAGFDKKGRRVVSGDVFRVVPAGKKRAVRWDVRAGWPDRIENIKAVVTAWPLNDKPPYMVVDISPDFSGDSEDRFRYYASSNGVPGGITENFLYKTNAIVFKRVYARHRDYHGKLTNDFYLAVFETTQAQWATVCGSVTARFKKNGWGRPMDNATYCQMRLGKGHNSNYDNSTWYYPSEPHADSFLGLLRSRCGGVCDFDIPLKEQWEFAAYAGHANGYWGNGRPVTTSGKLGSVEEECPNLNTHGRYAKNGGFVPANQAEYAVDFTAENDIDNGTAVVGSYEPNDWGFYDMSGNVCERVHLADGSAKTVMGGDCHDTVRNCRPIVTRSDVSYTVTGYSYSNAPYTGIRISCRNGLK